MKKTSSAILLVSALVLGTSSVATADILVDNFDNNDPTTGDNHLAENWDNSIWLGVDDGNPFIGQGLAGRAMDGISSIWVSNKTTFLDDDGGGDLSYRLSGAVLQSERTADVEKYQLISLNCHRTSGVADLTSLNYIRFTAWVADLADIDADSRLIATLSSPAVSAYPEISVGPWADASTQTDLGIDLTVTPTVYIIQFNGSGDEFAGDPVYQSLGIATPTTEPALTNIGSIGIGMRRVGLPAAVTMGAYFSVDDVMLLTNYPAINKSQAKIDFNIDEDPLGTTSADVDFVLDAMPSHDVTITPSFDNTQISITPASITFTTSDWDTPQSFTVSSDDDSDLEGDLVYAISYAITSADLFYAAETIANDNVTVIDDETGLTGEEWKSLE